MAFESEETVFVTVRLSNEQIQYQGDLTVADSGRERVSLALVFVPPHPFFMNMPERASIEAPSVTGVYSKLVRFLDEQAMRLRVVPLMPILPDIPSMRDVSPAD